MEPEKQTQELDEIEIDLNTEVDIDLDAELHEEVIDEPNSHFTVFIVDDDSFLLEMYAKKFKNSGFEVMTANGGAEAIEKIKGGDTPDIFLLDLIMPQMDGIELLANIKSENLIPKATKIVLSNQGQQTDMDEAEKNGVDGYIVKALHTPSEVVQMVIKIHKEKNK